MSIEHTNEDHWEPSGCQLNTQTVMSSFFAYRSIIVCTHSFCELRVYNVEAKIIGYCRQHPEELGLCQEQVLGISHQQRGISCHHFLYGISRNMMWRSLYLLYSCTMPTRSSSCAQHVPPILNLTHTIYVIYGRVNERMDVLYVLYAVAHVVLCVCFMVGCFLAAAVLRVQYIH